MNNTVENDFFGFPKVKWLHLTGDGQILTFHVNFSQDLTHTHTHTFNGPFSGTTQVSQYQKGKNQSGFY